MTIRAELNQILQNLAEYLDIPESYFERARARYESIGNWLEREESVVSKYKPEIYPQGSFSLGTVTKPVTNEDDYESCSFLKKRINSSQKIGATQ